MKLIKCILTNNDCYKAGKKITPKGICVHSTGANNPTLKRYVQPNVSGIGVNKYNNDWNRSGLQKCVHAFIGKLDDGTIATVQTLPWDRRGWHAGGTANNTHIGFEICEDGLTDKAYFDKVYQEAVELTAYLCKTYNLNPSTDVICHSEAAAKGLASNHGDVMHWFPKHGKSMDTFRQAVRAAMTNNSSGGGTTPTDNENTLYRVQVGAFTVKSKAEKMLADLKAAGFNGFIVETEKELDTIKVGDTVRVKQGAKTYTGGNLASFVYTRDHQVKEISGDRVVITYSGQVVAAVRMADLILV